MGQMKRFFKDRKHFTIRLFDPTLGHVPLAQGPGYSHFREAYGYYTLAFSFSQIYMGGETIILGFKTFLLYGHIGSNFGLNP